MATIKIGDTVIPKKFTDNNKFKFTESMWDLVGRPGPVQYIGDTYITVHDYDWPLTAIINRTATLQEPVPELKLKKYSSTMEDNLKPLYFKVGDQVVTNRFESIENGIAFNEDMADFVGMRGIITGIRSSGYPVVHGWSWPWSAIEHPNTLLKDNHEFNIINAQEIKDREAFINNTRDWIISQPDGERIYNEAISKLEADKAFQNEGVKKHFENQITFEQAKNKLMVMAFEHFENQIDTAKVERMVEKYKANPCASPEVWISLETLNDKEKEAFLTKVNSLPKDNLTRLKLSPQEIEFIHEGLEHLKKKGVRLAAGNLEALNQLRIKFETLFYDTHP